MELDRLFHYDDGKSTKRLLLGTYMLKYFSKIIKAMSPKFSNHLALMKTIIQTFPDGKYGQSWQPKYYGL